MAEKNDCTHDCAACGEECGERRQDAADLKVKPNNMSSISHVIGVVSGKGGVGKSLVTGMLAVLLNRRGYSTAVLDADITGPSIPKIFGIHEKAQGNEWGILPIKTKSGIDVMSVNLLLEDEQAPVVWRGPMIAGTVKQFWTDVIWADVDFMFIDMPPGTGDVPLTVFQSVPIDGIIIVTTPQELVSMIVAKAANMAKMMNVPILGMVENMSYVKCPDCGKEIRLFGESRIEETAKEFSIPVLGRLPVDPRLAKACDNGVLELFEADYLDAAADVVGKMEDKAQ
ncbi:MAG: Mrp/NBP35 family ATP-binding protein [Clostridia bacterium]|nr:Mrp/NBP35 family ATP-binding protein [Clostridia bacterium]